MAPTANSSTAPAKLGVIAVLAATGAVAIDYGPTYGQDYAGEYVWPAGGLAGEPQMWPDSMRASHAGLDYNVTQWHSDPSKSANHWQAAAIECENYCLGDPDCCTWTCE